MKKFLPLVVAGLILASTSPSFAIEHDPAPNTSTDSGYSQTTERTPSEANRPQVDTTERGHAPLVKTDPNKSVGNFVKESRLDENAMKEGFVAAHPIVGIVSKLVGWIVSLLVGTLTLFNLLGLFYVVVPLGFLRNIMSGGLSNSTGGASAPMMGGMGRVGMMGASSAPAGGGIISKLRMVPTSAIQAVALAEQGERGGASMGRPGMMGMGASPMGVGAQQMGGSAKPVRPIPYYLRAQAIDLVLIGVALVILVFSSVLFDTGLKLGNGLAQLIEWGISYVL